MFHLHSGDTFALKKWLTTKIIDSFKCTLLTMATAFITFTISLKKMFVSKQANDFSTQKVIMLIKGIKKRHSVASLGHVSITENVLVCPR